MKKTASVYAGELCVVLSAVLFGLMPLLVKSIMAQGGNAYVTALCRFFFGSLFLGMAVFIRKDISLKISVRQLREILLLSVFYALMPTLLFASYDYMDSGLATTLHFTFPVTVLLFSVLFFGIRPDAKQVFCTFLCAVGIGLLSSGEQAGFTGVWLAVASGITYALYIVFLGKSSLQGQSVLTIVFWISLLSSAEIAICAIVEGRLRLPSGLSAWGLILLLAFFSTTLALVLFQKGLFCCGPIRASLLSTFEPLTGVVVGAAVFGEILTAHTVAGILCVLGSGVLLVLPASAFSYIRESLFTVQTK